MACGGAIDTICTPIGFAGSDCTNTPCADYFFCDDSNTCSPQVALGGACTMPIDGQCMEGVRDTGHCALDCHP
jgi:hypothetical protein